VVNDAGAGQNAGNLVELAKRYEAQATLAEDDSRRVVLYKKAAAAHHELGSFVEEARCLSLACELLVGEERGDCLVSLWGVYINAIAVYRYEVGFEWKGEDENLDPFYGETIERYYNGAIDALDEALKTEGIKRDRLFEKLYADCVRRRNEGGWGASECFSSVDESFKGKHHRGPRHR
jgi:hypothetical protein